VAAIVMIFYFAIHPILHVWAQFSLFPNLKNEVLPTYLGRIVPGAAEKNNTLHYYPQNIAVPSATTIAWFNDEPGQPHTGTSGTPDSSESGKQFNSGIIPFTSFMHSGLVPAPILSQMALSHYGR